LRIRAWSRRRHPACLKSLLNLPEVFDQLLALGWGQIPGLLETLVDLPEPLLDLRTLIGPHRATLAEPLLKPGRERPPAWRALRAPPPPQFLPLLGSQHGAEFQAQLRNRAHQVAASDDESLYRLFGFGFIDLVVIQEIHESGFRFLNPRALLNQPVAKLPNRSTNLLLLLRREIQILGDGAVPPREILKCLPKAKRRGKCEQEYQPFHCSSSNKACIGSAANGSLLRAIE
jgi:hypothetical protein